MAPSLIYVFAAFDATPGDVMLGETITWTEITDDVRLVDGVNFRRGRTTHSGAVSAGTGGFTLDNQDGRYTPGYVTGAHHPLRLRTPVQIRTAPATTYDLDNVYDIDMEYDDEAGAASALWTGTVDTWHVNWVSGPSGQTRVSATDLVSHCARTRLESLPLAQLLAEGPKWVFPLDESSDSVEASDRVGDPGVGALVQTRLGATGSPTISFGAGFSPGSVGGSAESGVCSMSPYAATSGYYLKGSGFPDLGSGVTLDAMILPTSITRKQVAVQWSPTGSLTDPLQLGLDSSGKPFAYAGGSFYGTTITGSTAVSTSEWTHLAVETWMSWVTALAYLKLYANGVLVASGTYAWMACPLGGGELRVGCGEDDDLWDGNICNVGVWPGADEGSLGATAIARVAAGRDGFDDEKSEVRLQRVARAAGLSARAGTKGDTSMGSQYTKGKTAAQAFQDCAAAEGSPWYVDPAGLIQMNARSTRNTAVISTPEFVLSADHIDQGTGFTVDDSLMVNHVTATRPGGVEAITRKNQDSIDRYGQYPYTTDLWLRTDNDLAAFAEGLANLDAEPAPRSNTITVDMLAGLGDAAESDVVGAGIGGMFTVGDLPTPAPTASIDLFIEGTADVVSVNGWKRTFNTSRAERYSAWILGDSDLGTTTILGY